MRPQKVAIISATGTGRKRTLPALQDSELCTVTAIQGRNLEKTKDVAESFAVTNVYEDLNELIAERRFDIAMVCSPPFLHRSQMEILIRAGIPTLCEKPLALSAADAKAITALSNECDVPVRIAHHLRHHPAFKKIQTLILDDAIGAPKSAFFEWSFRMNPEAASSKWKLQPDLNGATALTDTGSHCLDVALALFGPCDVEAVVLNDLAPGGTFESCDVTLQHEGPKVVVRASRTYGPYSNQLAISGEKGEIRADEFFTEASASKISLLQDGQVQDIPIESANPYKLEVEDFARSLVDGFHTGLGTSLADAVALGEILDVVSQAAATAEDAPRGR